MNLIMNIQVQEYLSDLSIKKELKNIVAEKMT